MTAPKPLSHEKLHTACDPRALGFRTTAELAEVEGVIGQGRAVEAVRFGIGIRQKGYNLFALGPEGTGKFSLVERFVTAVAADESLPSDWCYVNNFTEPHKPRALRLPPGRARPLGRDMEKLLEDLRQAIPAAFDGEEYANRKEIIEEHFKESHEAAFGAFRKEASERGIAMVRTPMGLGLAPMKDDEILSPDEFKALPEKEQRKRAKALEELQGKMEELLRQVPRWEKEQREKIREMNRDVTRNVVSHQIEELAKSYEDIPEVIDYLHEVEQDVIDNVDDFLPQEQASGLAALTGGGRPQGEASFRRYQVNVMVETCTSDDASEETEKKKAEKPCGAPVVYEDHPTHPNLIGRIEHISQYGTLVTDFNLIKPGGLHRANGGYLIMDARKLLMQPFSYEALKRALRSEMIRVESPGESYGLVSTVTLQPEPIPLDVKVVLFGDPYLYYLLSRLDPEFVELFKVAADFDTRMDRDADTSKQFAGVIGNMIRKNDLLPMDSGGAACVIDHAARQCSDAEKLSTHMASIDDLVRESDYWARQDGKDVVTKVHVQKAIDAKIYRSDRIRERIQEEIQRNTLVIETAGARVGQINGLAVLQLDDFSFGKPSRISCTVRLGKGEVIDIEREVALGGPLHSKGVLILSSFIGMRYAKDKPLSLSASLVFEQSYGGVDGDSASSTELYVILSALSEIPINQSLAVTGSVDQMGRVQAIGGVNDKIEGFFDVCKARGLTGGQGVLIPAANVKHLMLRADVVEAAREGRFNIYPVETVDQGIEILTGIPAGVRGKDGSFPIGSVNRAVQKRLDTLTRKAREVERAALKRSMLDSRKPPPNGD
ncbi:MAG: AAA family ATPase [Rhodospirillales bacterium]|nr:AAA family ATPase [Rhodospirillales bacterium]